MFSTHIYFPLSLALSLLFKIMSIKNEAEYCCYDIRYLLTHRVHFAVFPVSCHFTFIFKSTFCNMNIKQVYCQITKVLNNFSSRYILLHVGDSNIHIITWQPANFRRVIRRPPTVKGVLNAFIVCSVAAASLLSAQLLLRSCSHIICSTESFAE
jgi:hypothetical protein